MKRNPGFFNKIQRKRKQKQTFEEACYQRKPPGLRPRQTVVVDNEGRYFLVSENTPEHQREAGYREVLVFPCDSAGEPYSWSEVGGRKNVDFSTFLADLLEGREMLDEELVELADGMQRNPGGAKKRARLPLADFGGPSDSAEIVLYDKPVGPFQRSAIGKKGKPDPDPSEAQGITHLPTGFGVPGPLGSVRAVMRSFALRWAALSEGEKRMLSEGYTYTLDRLADDGPSEAQIDALRDFIYGAVGEQEGAHRNPGGAKQIREQSRLYADELRFEAKHQRAVARAYPFQLRSESGVNESFQSHAEALKWAESNLKKGEFFTVSKDSDHFHEHYVKE